MKTITVLNTNNDRYQQLLSDQVDNLQGASRSNANLRDILDSFTVLGYEAAIGKSDTLQTTKKVVLGVNEMDNLRAIVTSAPGQEGLPRLTDFIQNLVTEAYHLGCSDKAFEMTAEKDLSDEQKEANG